MDEKKELTRIINLVQKDIEQFELLYSHTINKVYYWCYNSVKNETTAKDLAQESMIKIYQKIHTLDNPEAFNSWMYTIVRNICNYYLRSLKNTDVLFFESEEYTKIFEDTITEERLEHLPEESYNLKETKQLIVSFVENLPRKQKEVIILFYLEEFTTNEIAEIVNSNIVTVRSCLRYGRKNLKKQINEYQEKNNTKLYSTILLPLLQLLLQEHRNAIYNRQNLSYDESIYHSKATNVQETTSLNMFSTLGASLGAVIVVAFLSFIVLQNMSNREQSNVADSLYDVHTNIFPMDNKEQGNIADSLFSTTDVETFGKDKYDPCIESITYNTFRTRNSTNVLIHLKRDTDSKKINILFNGEEISFKKSGKAIAIVAKNNGEYTLVIDEKKNNFTVNQIDKQAPELVGIQNYQNYLQLIINDEYSQINYKKSYMEFEGKKYEISENNKVTGRFNGDTKIYIYNNLNQYIYYEFNLK